MSRYGYCVWRKSKYYLEVVPNMLKIRSSGKRMRSRRNAGSGSQDWSNKVSDPKNNRAMASFDLGRPPASSVSWYKNHIHTHNFPKKDRKDRKRHVADRSP